MSDDWGEWEVVRRQVALCGRMSPALVDTVRGASRWTSSPSRRRPSDTMASISVWTCRLASTGSLRRTGAAKCSAERTAHVSRNAAGDVTFAVVDIELTPPRGPAAAVAEKEARSQ